MVGFDIGLGLAVEGLSPPRLEKGRSDVHIKKATPPSYSSVVSGKYSARGREPPMLSGMLDFQIDGAGIPGGDKWRSPTKA